jgi:serpin B
MEKLPKQTSTTTSNFQLEIVKGINEKNIGKNIMVSPLSIYHILSLTANGAANITLEEMLKTLGHNKKIELNKENSSISSIISKLKSIQMANAIFTKFKPEPDFLKEVGIYKSTIEDLKSVEQVNSWCSKATNGKIPRIIDDINNVMMILINAIYFKGIWKKTFDNKLTRKNDFLNFNKEKKLTDFMNISHDYRYFESNNVQAIEIDYNKDNLNVLIILPKAEKDINVYLKNFSMEKYGQINKGLRSHKVNLSLPKFEIRYEGELKEILISLGMKSAFGNANFSVMRKQNDILISRVIHKTFIKVDEQGTEAAAVTAVVMRKMAAFPIDPPKVMIVNHPFLFIIRSKDLPSGHDILFFTKIECL